MSDNIFDRLFELFQSQGPVNWRLGAEVRKSLTGEPEPIDPALSEEYQSLEMAASLRLAELPGVSVPTAAPLHPVDRVTWSTENEQSYRYLVEPLAGKFGNLGIDSAALGPMGAFIQQMGPAMLGMQAGSLVGFLSRTVMGQFDVGMPALDHDRRYLIVPNVEAFAAAHRFDHQQVRMWAVANEIAHHAIVHTDGVRAHVVTTVGAFFDSLEYDTSGIEEIMSDLQDPMQLQRAIGEGDGLPALIGTTFDESALRRVRALFAFIEGYGNHLATGAVSELLPEWDRIAAAATDRRRETGEAGEALRQLTGLALDRSDATAAAVLCAEIERRYGPETLAGLLDDHDALPRLEELDDVVGWIARTQLG
jgi:putative hydrolase